MTNGLKFEAEIQRSAAALELHYQKLAVPMRLNQQKRLVKLKDNPYDSFFVHRGIHVALELKSIQGTASFPLSNIEDHQVEGLKRNLQAGGVSWLLICCGVGKERATYALNFLLWEDMLASLPPHNGEARKSIPIKTLSSPDYFVPLGKSVPIKVSCKRRVPPWDLRPLLPGGSSV